VLVPASGRLGAAPAKAVTALPPASDTLRVGIGIQPDNLEISQVTNSAVATLLEHVVETLVKVDPAGNLVPGLAERWEASADGRQFTFYLPRGVTFQDGTPLTAEAVVWNVNRLQELVLAVADCPVAAELAPLQGVEALDSTTVRYTLSQPVPNFPATLSWIAYGILSPQSTAKSANKLLKIQHPVGTGPFAFESLTAGELTLVRFAGYRGEAPYFNRLAFKFVSSVQQRESGLASGALDVILLPGAQQLASFSQDSQYKVDTKTGTRTIFVALNNRKPPFDDVRVRQAVNLAIDKQAIIDEVLLGAAAVMDAPVAPGIFGYCPVGSYRYDPAAARALLDEAKVEPGTAVTLLTPRGRYLEDEAVAQRIAGYLRDVGFTVTVQALEWPALMGALYRPPEQVTADMHLFGWAPTIADAGWQLPQLFDSKNWPPLGPASSFYKNPEVDAWLDQAQQATDPLVRKSLFCNAENAIWDDAPVAFLWVQGFPVVHKAGLTNIVSLPNEKISVAFARPAIGEVEQGTQPAAAKTRADRP
jgi:peptide/nickel transport system substrate-binding protein